MAARRLRWLGLRASPAGGAQSAAGFSQPQAVDTAWLIRAASKFGASSRQVSSSTCASAYRLKRAAISASIRSAATSLGYVCKCRRSRDSATGRTLNQRRGGTHQARILGCRLDMGCACAVRTGRVTGQSVRASKCQAHQLNSGQLLARSGAAMASVVRPVSPSATASSICAGPERGSSRARGASISTAVCAFPARRCAEPRIKRACGCPGTLFRISSACSTASRGSFSSSRAACPSDINGASEIETLFSTRTSIDPIYCYDLMKTPAAALSNPQQGSKSQHFISIWRVNLTVIICTCNTECNPLMHIIFIVGVAHISIPARNRGGKIHA